MLIDRAMCPLREAAALIGVEASFLVREAIERNVWLYAKIPLDCQVLSIHSSHRNGSSGRSLASNSGEVPPIPPFAMPALLFLVIEPPSLVGLYNNGLYRVAYFEEGISFDRDGKAHVFDASVHWDIHDAFHAEEVSMPQRSYALYPADFEPPWNNSRRLRSPMSLEITWDNVYVKRVDVTRLARQTVSKTAPVLKRIQSWEGRHISQNLRGLRSLLMAEISLSSSEGLRTLSPGMLEMKLKEQFAFTGSQAKAGATILLRSLDTLYQIERHSAEGEPAILTLFECADKFWGDTDADTLSHPSLDDITAWLKSRLGLTDTPAKGCAAMIRPDQVSKGGRRKNPVSQ